jgi:predicted esterase
MKTVTSISWRLSRVPLLVLLCTAPLYADDVPCDERTTSGEVVTVPYDGYHGFIRTYLPRELPPDGKLPVIVHYHGYGDGLEPNVRIPRAITADRYFLLVGMDYGSRRFYASLDRRRVDEEVERLRALVGWLEQCLPIDREAIYLSGYSQGAFATSLVGERALDLIDGMILLAGGQPGGDPQSMNSADFSGLPVFVGFGEQDETYGKSARVTGQVYAMLGARVSLEVWPGRDHVQSAGWFLEDPAHVVNINNWLLDNTFFRQGEKD